MNEGYVTYRRFTNTAELTPLAAFLSGHGIDYLLEDVSGNFDPSYANNEFQKDFRLKLHRQNFEKVDLLLQEFYNEAIDELPADYYLYDFTDTELMAVVSKWDEWGILDFLLAQKLLKERGKPVDSALLKRMEHDRLKELAMPEKSSRAWIIFSYITVLFGGFIGICIGLSLLGKKTLPDGTRAYIYVEQDREHGKRILTLGAAVAAFLALSFLYKTFIRS